MVPKIVPVDKPAGKDTTSPTSLDQLASAPPEEGGGFCSHQLI